MRIEQGDILPEVSLEVDGQFISQASLGTEACYHPVYMAALFVRVS